MKIVTVVGARPQFIKAAVVSRAIATEGGRGLREVIVHTGQHYDTVMSDVFFDELGIPLPSHHLGVGSGRHGEQTAEMLRHVEDVLLREQPDRVLVYGDTNSTLAGALAAAKLNMPVAHVEAGLRSFNRRMPEEVNRVLTDHVADLLFAPTAEAVRNLEREGCAPETVHLVGDVMFDASLHYGVLADRQSTILADMGIEPRTYVLATLHRAENTDDPVRLRAAVEGLARAASRRPVILPLHPRTQGALARQGLNARDLGGVRVIEPVGYLDMVALERNARLIATDSGGVQKEAFFYRVACVTLRDETEWVELLHMGWNRLAPPTSAEVVEAAIEAADRAPPGAEEMPYGDGRAAHRIVQRLLESS